MPAPDRLRVHGLTVATTIPLAAPPAPTGAELDLTIREVSPKIVPGTVAEGDLLRLQPPPHAYSMTRAQGRYLLRFDGVAEIEFDPEQREVTLCRDPNAPVHVLEVLLPSTTLAWVLDLWGHCVVHASAVVTNDRAVAFAADAAGGKSTTAALLTTTGARLLTDDALRVAFHPTRTMAFAGTRDLRLRADMATLATELESTSIHTSDDQRCVVRLPDTTAPPDPVRLAAVAVLSRRDDCLELRAHRLHGSEALVAMLRHLRMPTWRDARLTEHQFRSLATLIRAVPTYRLDVPAESRPTRDFAQQLRSWVDGITGEA